MNRVHGVCPIKKRRKTMMKVKMVVMGGALGLALLGTAEAQTLTGAQPAPQERIRR